MNIRRSTLLGTAIAFALYQQSAYAQAAPSADAATGADEIDEVIVTGVRASLEKSRPDMAPGIHLMRVATTLGEMRRSARNSAD